MDGILSFQKTASELSLQVQCEVYSSILGGHFWMVQYFIGLVDLTAIGPPLYLPLHEVGPAV